MPLACAPRPATPRPLRRGRRFRRGRHKAPVEQRAEAAGQRLVRDGPAVEPAVEAEKGPVIGVPRPRREAQLRQRRRSCRPLPVVPDGVGVGAVRAGALRHVFPVSVLLVVNRPRRAWPQCRQPAGRVQVSSPQTPQTPQTPAPRLPHRIPARHLHRPGSVPQQRIRGTKPRRLAASRRSGPNGLQADPAQPGQKDGRSAALGEENRMRHTRSFTLAIALPPGMAGATHALSRPARFRIRPARPFLPCCPAFRANCSKRRCACSKRSRRPSGASAADGALDDSSRLEARRAGQPRPAATSFNLWRNNMRFLRSFALVLALAFLILPAAPLGGVVPIPTVGGDAAAMYGCDYRDWQCLDEKDDWDTDGDGRTCTSHLRKRNATQARLRGGQWAACCPRLAALTSSVGSATESSSVPVLQQLSFAPTFSALQ